jgi:parallel beta-helix repeat protein
MIGDRKATFGILVVLLLVFALFPLIESVKAESSTIVVPDDYSTIQEAINHANERDTIIVKAGTYNENVVVHKTLTIESQSGAETTIVRTAEPDTQKNVFEILADNVAIKGFTVTVIVGWGGDGIHLYRVENCVISDNVCFDNGIGIHLTYSHNNVIMNNNVSNNQWGCYLHESNGNQIVGNIASNSSSSAGICLAFSSYNKVLNNTANQNDSEGIELLERGTTNNLIAHNILCSNRLYGIHLFAADNNSILNNAFLNSSRGIWLRGASKDNLIANNIIRDCYKGIFLGDPSNELGDCNDNIIYLNVFENFYDLYPDYALGNPCNVYSYESINFWNSPEKTAYTYENDSFIGYLGNYWNDYNGSDTNGDGIGDVPHVIDENNQDNYPLMNPWNGSSCAKTDGNMRTYKFDFSYGYGYYIVVVSTNSTFEDLSIDQNRISFLVTGPTGTTGVAKIIIPEDLTGSNFTVCLNDSMLLENSDYTKTYNGTHTIIDITYSHSTHLLKITGTNIIPEYTSWLIPTVLLVATLGIVIYKKKRST